MHLSALSRMATWIPAMRRALLMDWGVRTSYAYSDLTSKSGRKFRYALTPDQRLG